MMCESRDDRLEREERWRYYNDPEPKEQNFWWLPFLFVGLLALAGLTACEPIPQLVTGTLVRADTLSNGYPIVVVQWDGKPMYCLPSAILAQEDTDVKFDLTSCRRSKVDARLDLLVTATATIRIPREAP